MIKYDEEAIQYLAKIADGGMRDAITYMDKCLSYSDELTIENVVKALGLTDYEVMFKLNSAVLDNKPNDIIDIVESIHSAGKDLKIFMRSYMQFLIDVCKYHILGDFKYINIPNIYAKELDSDGDYEKSRLKELLTSVIKLNSDIKWDTSPKYVIEATLLLEVNDGKNN